jgi:hypothetical protein
MTYTDQKVTLREADNGWILEGYGQDDVKKTIVCLSWADVMRELEKWFHIKPTAYTTVDVPQGIRSTDIRDATNRSRRLWGSGDP